VVFFPHTETLMKPLPVLSDDLLTELDHDFPHRCPEPTDSEREIWMKAGARRLIDSLLARQSIHTGKLPDVYFSQR
jgi:hypothetical protein